MKTKKEIEVAINLYKDAINFERDKQEKDRLTGQMMALQWVLE